MEDKHVYEVWMSILNKIGLWFENTTNTILGDNFIIEVVEEIDLERDSDALIVDTPENEFDQEIFENERKINIIHNIVLIGSKIGEINDKKMNYT